jgi:hypothetical protein
MKKILIALLLLPAFVFAQTKGFTIKGKVSGIADGEVKLTSTQDAHQVLATSQAKAGEFTLQGTVPEPSLLWLVMGAEQPIYIYVENTEMKVTGTKQDIKKLKIEGSSSQKDFDEFQSTFNPLIGELNGFAAQLQQAGESKKEKLMVQYDSVVSQINKEVGNYVANKKSSYVTPFVLFVTAQLNPNPTQLEQYYNSLDAPIRKSNIGKSLSEFIA